MASLVGLYATVITIVLFFQGMEISRWAAYLQRLKDRREKDRDALLTEKSKAEDYLEDLGRFKRSFPGVLGWTYIVVQAVLVVSSVIALVPAAYPNHLLLGECPFIVLGVVCVILWPTLICFKWRSLAAFEKEVMRRHRLGPGTKLP